MLPLAHLAPLFLAAAPCCALRLCRCLPAPGCQPVARSRHAPPALPAEEGSWQACAANQATSPAPRGGGNAGRCRLLVPASTLPPCSAKPTRERQALKGEVTTSSLSGEGSTQVLKRSTSGYSSCREGRGARGEVEGCRVTAAQVLAGMMQGGCRSAARHGWDDRGALALRQSAGCAGSSFQSDFQSAATCKRDLLLLPCARRSAHRQLLNDVAAQPAAGAAAQRVQQHEALQAVARLHLHGRQQASLVQRFKGCRLGQR